MKILGKTDIGRVRSTNQDCYCAGEHDSGMIWAVVCDGMGGHAGGNIASSTAAKVLSDNINLKYKKNMSSRSVKNLLLTSISAANVNVYDMAKLNDELDGMGTTAVAAIIVKNVAHIINVGDSRAYVLNDSGITQVTKDHSLVQQMIDYGKLTAQEAKTHPHRNIITNAVGIHEDIQADYFELDMCEGDILLMCTDGLTNNVSDEEIYGLVKDNQSCDFIEKLVERANENGGSDNITVVAVTA
ncbi:MAG: Stp1/IreP family PP2C-type Ser/Thr phosphatase [Clostridia bacterium]|nr:Stp1/IreP family PP2C-type Ser/Thr phosphatase [Clostridia bacterium]